MDKMKQRTEEWDNLDSVAMTYHSLQWEQQKESTVFLEKNIKKWITSSRKIIDLGCGAGGATSYLALNNASTEFIGIDYSSELINLANFNSSRKVIENLSFCTGDWLNLEPYNDVDGVVSLQTLSWLPDFNIPLLQIFKKINPKWIALTSLFYEGDISCKIEVNEHACNKKSFYNIYSIPAIDRLCRDHGYQISKFIRFDISVDIPKPINPDRMATYTISTTERRIQLSGPLLMNWYLLIIEKQNALKD